MNAVPAGPSPIVVLDTNVFVAAGFNPRSASARIIEAVRRGAVPIVWSDATRAETERIMRRIPPLSADAFLDLFRSEDRFDGPADPDAFGHVPDAEDRKFAALAVAAGATVVSNDGHLLGAAGGELSVLSPGEFLASL
jgi:predicted nucleic acid-binding protein